MRLSCAFLTPFAVFARRKWRKLLFCSIDHCILGWPCCWARCWMLQDVDHMEASCVFYVMVGNFDQFEQCKISVLTVTSLGIVMLTVHYDSMVSRWFMWDPSDSLRQTSPDVFSVKEWFVYIHKKWDISHRSIRCIPVNERTTSDLLTANRETVEIPCSYTLCSYKQPDSTWIEGASWLSLIPFWLVANYIIFRTSHFFS